MPMYATCTFFATVMLPSTLFANSYDKYLELTGMKQEWNTWALREAVWELDIFYFESCHTNIKLF
jgi:hypothetical protein